MKVADNIVKSSQNNTEIDINNNKKLRLSIDKKADMLFYDIIENNENAKDWYDKRYISNSFLRNLQKAKK